MARVFISYARDDVDRALILKGLLEGRAHEAWVDLEQIPAGSPWRPEIQAAIERSDVLVFALSPDSVASAECRRELDHAVSLRKRLVPVVLRDVDVDVSDGRLRDLDWVFFRESDDRETALRRLDQAIALDLEHLRAHTRILLAALEWDRSRGVRRSAVLRGRRLAEASQWLAEAVRAAKEPAPTELHRRFLAASQVARRWRIGSRVTLGVAAVVVTALLGARLWEQLVVTESQDLASRARQAADTPTALRLAVEARKTARTPSSVRALLDALARSPQLERVLAVGPDEIEALAFHPRGDMLAAAGRDGVVHAWSTNAWVATRAPFAVSQDRVTQIAFLEHGTRLASGGWDGVVRISSFDDGTVERELRGGDLGLVEAFVIHPSGRWLVAGYTLGARLWDLASQPATAVDLLPGGRRVNAVSFTQDGAHLAAVEGTKRLHVWSFADGTLADHRTRDVSGATALSFDLSGERLITGIADTRLVSVATNDLEDQSTVTTPAAKSALALGFSDDEELLAIGGSDGFVHVRSPSGMEVVDLPLAGRVFAVAFQPGGHRVVASGTDPRIWVWNPDVVERLARRRGSWPGSIQDVRLGGADGGTIVAGTLSGDVLRGHVGEDGALRPLPVGTRGSVAGVALAGDLVFWGDDAGQLGAWSLAEDTGVILHRAPGGITAVAADDDGRLVAFGVEGGGVRLMERRAGGVWWSEPVELDVGLPSGRNAGRVFRVRMSADGALLAVGDGDGNVVVWDVGTRRPRASWSVEGTAVDIAFSPDGEWLAVASYEGAESTILSLSDASAPVVVHTGCSQTSSVGFRRDGALLVFGCKDGTLQLFDAPSWQPVGRVIGTGESVDALWPSAFDDSMVAATDTGDILLLDLDERAWMRRACWIVAAVVDDATCGSLLHDAPPDRDALERRDDAGRLPIPNDVALLRSEGRPR